MTDHLDEDPTSGIDRTPENLLEKDNIPKISQEMVIDRIMTKEDWAPQFEKLRTNNPEEVDLFLNDAIDLYEKLEELANKPLGEILGDDATKIKALWVLSAPGAYFQARKEDRFSKFPWATWMDRRRLNFAFDAGRKITEIITSQKLPEHWYEAVKILKENAPKILYAGRPDENAAVETVQKTPWFRVPDEHAYPSEKIEVMDLAGPSGKTADPSKVNTLDQVKFFNSPTVDFGKDGMLGAVVHAPQAMRTLLMMGQFPEAFPKNRPVKIIPLPSPKDSSPEYQLMELSAAVFYRFFSTPPVVSDQPFPYRQ